MKLLFLTVSILLLASSCQNDPLLKNVATGEWQQLISEDLHLWEQHSGDCIFQSDRGNIVAHIKTSRSNSYLSTRKSYDDFDLELEFYLDPGLGSGLIFRSQIKQIKSSRPKPSFGQKVKKTKPRLRLSGYKYVFDHNRKRSFSGGIYHEGGSDAWLHPLTGNDPARLAFKPKGWNELRILCIGDHIRTWINGVPAADFTHKRYNSGPITLPINASRVDDPRVILWRKIRIRKISPLATTQP